MPKEPECPKVPPQKPQHGTATDSLPERDINAGREVEPTPAAAPSKEFQKIEKGEP
jgi:hypothetical protein